MEWGDKRQLNEIKFENKGTKKQKKKRKEGHDVKNEKASLDSFEEKKKKGKEPLHVLFSANYFLVRLVRFMFCFHEISFHFFINLIIDLFLVLIRNCSIKRS